MTRTNTLYITEHYYLALASSLLLVLVGLYMYLISASVVHVVMQKEIKHNFAELHSDIAALEAQYIAAQHAVSADIASMHGFVATAEKIFIERSDSVVVVSRAQ